MKVEFKKSFTKDLKKVKDKNLLHQVKEAIDEIEQAPSLQVVKNLKQLKGGISYFRAVIASERNLQIFSMNTFEQKRARAANCFYQNQNAASSAITD